MKQRIIEVPYETCGAVLLAIVRDKNDGEERVEISAWHQDDDNVNYYQRETVSFSDISRCERFIADYSEQSACEFVESFNF